MFGPFFFGPKLSVLSSIILTSLLLVLCSTRIDLSSLQNLKEVSMSSNRGFNPSYTLANKS